MLIQRERQIAENNPAWGELFTNHEALSSSVTSMLAWLLIQYSLQSVPSALRVNAWEITPPVTSHR